MHIAQIRFARTRGALLPRGERAQATPAGHVVPPALVGEKHLIAQMHAVLPPCVHVCVRRALFVVLAAHAETRQAALALAFGPLLERLAILGFHLDGHSALGGLREAGHAVAVARTDLDDVQPDQFLCEHAVDRLRRAHRRGVQRTPHRVAAVDEREVRGGQQRREHLLLTVGSRERATLSGLRLSSPLPALSAAGRRPPCA
eukprot:4116149-Prymnesium_polylepis.1